MISMCEKQFSGTVSIVIFLSIKFIRMFIVHLQIQLLYTKNTTTATYIAYSIHTIYEYQKMKIMKIENKARRDK